MNSPTTAPAKNILAVVDPTANMQPAVDKASRLAKEWNAALELFICDYRPGLEAPTAAKARDALLEHRLAALMALAEPLRKQGLRVATDASFDNPLHEGLLRKIAASHADLVVKDTHYHNLLRRTIITNTDWQLIRHCAPPLLLVKPTHWSSTPRTLAAIDPGHAGDKPAVLDHAICEWSAQLARALQGEAHAVHMYFPESLLVSGMVGGGLPGTPIGNEQSLIEQERQARLQQVYDVTTAHGIPHERTRLMLGTAIELLTEEAERVRTDIVVMGAVSRSRLKNLFIGSTAERVLDHLPCDILVVKPLEFSSDLPF